MTSLLEARGISMSFPGVRALDGVDFDVVAGEVHALIGENGAGKSTLVHILTGEIAADAYEGEVRLDGAIRRLATPREAIEGGIAVIPQELQLVSTLSAAENIFLGREPRTPLGLIDVGELHRRCAAELEAVGETRARPAQTIERLEPGQRQLVAIARALSLDARLIIMDEPTAALGAEEAAPARAPRPAALRARRRGRVHLAQARRGAPAGRTASRCCATAGAWRRATRRVSTRPRWCA